MEGKDKKQIILEKAEELFASHGFSGTSVRDIASVAGVNVAMISYYFGCKEKLLMEIFRHRSDYLQTKIDDLLNNDSLSSWNRLELLIDYYVQKLLDNRSLHRIIMREVDMNADTKMSDYILERKKMHFDRFHLVIKKGQGTGEFCKDVDVVSLYILLPAISKQIIFNQDFVRLMIKETTSSDPTENDLIELTKDYLKTYFKKLLEVK